MIMRIIVLFVERFLEFSVFGSFAAVFEEKLRFSKGFRECLAAMTPDSVK